jgi:hypothetical protein
MEKSSKKTIHGVVCSVVSCYYNSKNGHCTAKQIEVGPMRATNCTETVCATYKPDPEKAEGRIF